MIYSCFDPRVGLYDYYEDARTRPINADLPIPDLAVSTPLGAAAIDSGRELPRDAKKVGQGWHARGSIVQCGRGSQLSGILDDSSAGSLLFAGLGAVVGVFYVAPALSKSMDSTTRGAVGAAVGAGLGYATLKVLGVIF